MLSPGTPLGAFFMEDTMADQQKLARQVDDLTEDVEETAGTLWANLKVRWFTIGFVTAATGAVVLKVVF